MIKIIKRGTRQQIECSECGCYFSFDEEDIEKQVTFCGHAKIIRCPQCEKVITLEATK